MAGASNTWSRAIIALYVIGALAATVVLSILVGVLLHWIRRKGKDGRASGGEAGEPRRGESPARSSRGHAVELPV